MTIVFRGLAMLAGLVLVPAGMAQLPVGVPTPADARSDGQAAQPAPTLPADDAPDPAAIAAAAAASAAAQDAADVELASFVAGVVEGIRARTGIAGVIVSVVRDDRMALSRGYGDAVVDPRRAADADTTMFRVGSISKTFTYTAALQLVERGVIGLDDPVNGHLPEAIHVPDDGYAEPVRVRHLLSHTAGFEDTALGHLFVRDPARVPTLVDYLATHRPARVRAPDTAAVYSNYSVALLGALVAHTSRMPFEDYIEQNITGPLAMTRATFREPLPDSDPRRIDPNLGADIARGYRRSGGTFDAGEFEYIAHGAPAGGLSATATDMARWMRVHLNGGELDGVRILSAENALRLREILFRNAPDVAGIGHGFMTEQYGPYFAYGHGGATLYFHSGMALLPEPGLGVFVSANTGNARAAVRDIVRLIVEHLAPDAQVRPVATPMSADQLRKFAGVYRNDRRPYRRAEKAVLGLAADTHVRAHADGTLRVHGGAEPLRMLPVGPMTFQDAEGNGRIQFSADSTGTITGYSHGSGVSTLTRVALIDRAAGLYGLLAIAVLIAIARLWRRAAVPQRRSARPGLVGVKALSILSALTWLAFAGTAIAAAITMAGQGNALVYTYPTTLFLWALGLATAAALVTMAEVVAILPVLRSRWQVGPKLRYLLAVVLLVLAVVVLWRWNLIGMKV